MFQTLVSIVEPENVSWSLVPWEVSPVCSDCSSATALAAAAAVYWALTALFSVVLNRSASSSRLKMPAVAPSMVSRNSAMNALIAVGMSSRPPRMPCRKLLTASRYLASASA